MEARTATRKLDGSSHAEAVLAVRLFDLVPFQHNQE